MEIRPVTPTDLQSLTDIDGTIESTDYLHLERSGEGLSVALKLEQRPLREKLIESNPINDDLKFSWKQVVTGIEEGMTLAVEHESQLVAALLAKPDTEFKTLRLIDLRIDYDFRRQGFATRAGLSDSASGSRP